MLVVSVVQSFMAYPDAWRSPYQQQNEGTSSFNQFSVNASNSSSDDDDDDRRVKVAHVVMLVAAYHHQRYHGMPIHNLVHTGSDRLRELLDPNRSPKVIYETIRMDVNMFTILSDFLNARELLKRTTYMSTDEQLVIFLHIVGQGLTIRQAAHNWQHSVETVHRCFKKVMCAILTLEEDIIRPPDYDNVQPFILENAYKYRPWFDVSNSATPTILISEFNFNVY